MDLIDEILTTSRTIAVVGLSDNPNRDSHRVASYLQRVGYRIIPVNPTIDEVLGERCYPDLISVPDSVDMVDIFRRSDKVAPVVDEAIRKSAKYVWMQDGVADESAAERARAAGIAVVMDNCTMREHRRRYGTTRSQEP
ncbi:MAG: CoA-binding protein [Chloroflexi bacterium]|nr:CoA-binding protein [Chloroflexota bacterium]